MPLGRGKPAITVLHIDLSDDEDGLEMAATPTNASTAKTATQTRPQLQEDSRAITPLVPSGETLESRSFWKAGAYSVGSTSNNDPAQGLLEHARVHPKFLHSNATSHKWAFGAIAELLDNAVDEINNGATYVKVDKIDIVKDNSPGLLFQDDGGGMDPEGIRKCMSLGYSSKKSKTTIGQYGNGFKTSTMRLGADVVVFSRATHGSKATQSVGLLSYTFLRKTGQDDVIVPMIDFDISGHWAEPIVYGSHDDWSSNLKTILEWSPFASKEELMQQHVSYCLRYSLRAYASILYLRKFKNFNIILRGKPVQQCNIADELKYVQTVKYRPQVAVLKEVVAETTIGFIKEAPSLPVCGFNVYHKNRLIKPFWKVTADGSSKGHGVVGVLEANFIEPAHDKQDFERSSLFVRLESRLKQMIMEYWKDHCHLVGYQPLGSSAQNTQKGLPAQSHVGHKPQPNQQNTSCAVIQEEVHFNRPIVGLPSNLTQKLRNEHAGNSLTAFPPSITLEPVFLNEVTSEEDPVPLSVEQICEENINLFMRCEENVQKEAELKHTIEKLENELEEAKRKCAQLAAHMKKREMERLMKQQTRKVL
ncbi:protein MICRORCHIDIA 2-like [Carica papaya]|uniref:protein MICRORCHIDIA 2-like n=1 Tax=Carica papaya TaxID=3649 RepID=UPI000B8CAC40|nr:protein MICRORCHIDIA 2-like [Carica papaya]